MTTAQDNRQLIVRFVEAHERADFQAIRELVTEDVTWHLPPCARYRRITAVSRGSGRGRMPRALPRVNPPSTTHLCRAGLVRLGAAAGRTLSGARGWSIV
jgi:hypothetical protein